jgi:hypothetical protein
MLPSFDKSGALPAGDYSLTLPQLRDSFLVQGNERCVAGWDVTWRTWLVSQLELLAAALWQVGIEHIWIDGSFVENVARLNDIDGYFEVAASYFHLGHLERDLQALGQPSQDIWNWSFGSLRPDANGKGKPLMWHTHRIELFPHHPGLPSGILNRYGVPMELDEAFRKRRRGGPKGIIHLQRQESED